MLFFKTGPGVAPYVIHLPRVDTRRCGDMLLPRISQPAKYGRLWSRDLRRGFRDFHGGRQRSVSSWGRLLTAALPFLQTMLTLRRHESTMRLTPFLIALRFRISLADFVTEVYRCLSTAFYGDIIAVTETLLRLHWVSPCGTLCTSTEFSSTTLGAALCD
jgi:hypothetical protein